MSLEQRAWVVDASVAIQFFVIEPFTEQVKLLFAQLADEPPGRLYVPDLFFSECANILWKYVRRHDYPVANARRDVIELRALNIGRISTTELVADALEIALTYEISAYDACYAALAGRLALPLLTADEALARKLAAAPYDVRTLRDLVIPPPL